MNNPIRRVVTGHDDRGKGVVVIDGNAPNATVRPGVGVTSTLLWVTDETPADISGRSDRADRTIGVPPPPRGSIFRIVDFPPVGPEVNAIDNATMLSDMGLDPNDALPARHPYMHCTRSVDYAIVLSGEIDMLLDDTEVHLRAGDVLVQQGTNHAWVNNGGQTCRIAFILIAPAHAGAMLGARECEKRSAMDEGSWVSGESRWPASVTPMMSPIPAPARSYLAACAMAAVGRVRSLPSRCLSPSRDAKGNPRGEFTYQGNVANRALELLGKEIGMFVDRKEVGGPGAFADLNDEELQEAIIERTRELAELDPEFAEFAKQLAQQKRATEH